jgi:DNA polymerase-3 subunit delta
VQLKADQLEQHLARDLKPLYVVHGDEPLLALEAADAIRARARGAGYTVRDVYTVERGFDWSAFANAAAGMSLFGDRKVLELRLPTGKPGTEGAAAIERHCRRLSDDTVTLVTLPRLDRAGQGAAWFGALAEAGVVVNVFPVDRVHLSSWIAGRLARQKQKASEDALAFIAGCVEGNLLAAHQEIQKLGLLYPPGALTEDQVRDAVLDVARYDVAQIGAGMLGGDSVRLARVLHGLEAEGEAPHRVLWVVAEEVRAVMRVQAGLAAGRPVDQLLRESRVWGEPRTTLVVRAARRIAAATLERALARAAAIDRMVKGLTKGNPWDELLRLGLTLQTTTERGRSA